MTESCLELLVKGKPINQNQQEVLDLLTPFLPKGIRGFIHCSPTDIGIALTGNADLSGVRTCILINGWKHCIYEDKFAQIIWIYEH